MVADNSQSMSVSWSPYGKILQNNKAGGANLTFGYNAMQQRVLKRVVLAGDTTRTYYIRDAQGNTMGVYTRHNDSVTWREQYIFGSSRLGLYRADTLVNKGLQTISKLYEGKRNYELTNHLGNVMVVINDRKTDSLSGTTKVGFNAVVISATDYFPFGMAIDSRSYTSSLYRYGFNGKENDKETGEQDYGMRIYDPRIAKFLSIDPLSKKYPELSPYQFASNTPIQAIDLDGLEGVRITKGATLVGTYEAHYEEKIDGNWTTKPIQGRTFGLYKTYLTAPNRFNLNTVLAIRSDSDVDNDASQTNTGGTQQGSTSYTYKGMYINPDEVNFFAFPSKDKGIGSALDKEGLVLGDLGMALTSNGNGGYNAVIGIYADHGPSKMTGEQSSKGNSGLGFGTDPNKGGSNKNNVYYLAFPKTAKFWQAVPETFRDSKGVTQTRSLQEKIQLGFSKMYKNMQLDSNIKELFTKMMSENEYNNFDNKPEVEKTKKTKKLKD